MKRTPSHTGPGGRRLSAGEDGTLYYPIFSSSRSLSEALRSLELKFPSSERDVLGSTSSLRTNVRAGERSRMPPTSTTMSKFHDSVPGKKRPPPTPVPSLTQSRPRSSNGTKPFSFSPPISERASEVCLEFLNSPSRKGTALHSLSSLKMAFFSAGFRKAIIGSRSSVKLFVALLLVFRCCLLLLSSSSPSLCLYDVGLCRFFSSTN